jgi:hypothetical protein
MIMTPSGAYGLHNHMNNRILNHWFDVLSDEVQQLEETALMRVGKGCVM